MIQVTDRVSSILARDEGLIEVFVEASPKFQMLRNKAARKTMARLVTIEQAAKIAGIDAAELAHRLNTALGEASDAPADSPAATAPRPEAVPAAAPPPPGLLQTPEDKLVDLDVREDLRQGKEPFHRIMQASLGLKPGQVLRLSAIFEPAPLYAVLAKQGLGHYTERFSDDDWRVWFYHDESARPIAAGPSDPIESAVHEDDVVVLDVRGLEPPEPMVQTLEALASLPRGKTLMQINVRVPQFLIPKLAERGFIYEVREQSPDLVRIFIRHQ